MNALTYCPPDAWSSSTSSLRLLLLATAAMELRGEVVTRGTLADRTALGLRTVKRLVPVLLADGHLMEPRRGVLASAPGAAVAPLEAGLVKLTPLGERVAVQELTAWAAGLPVSGGAPAPPPSLPAGPRRPGIVLRSGGTLDSRRQRR